MYQFGAQLDHEEPFLFHFEDLRSEFRSLGNELEKKLVSICRKYIFGDIPGVPRVARSSVPEAE